MRALFDVNLLIALLDEQHVRHTDAALWWSANRADGWASCPLSQNGFVRVICQPRYAYPLTAVVARDVLARQISQTDHAFWPDDVSLLDPALFDHARIAGPKQLTDVYLLALAVKHGGRLATLDRTIPLTAVRGAEARHVTVI